MKLIVDSGSTKASWALTQAGVLTDQVHTAGISPYFMDDTAILNTVQEVQRGFPNLEPDEVHFYGTGCNALEQRQRLERLFTSAFPQATTVRVYTDIAGAARACCQRDAGITGILGTGSNACRFDGTNVVDTAGGLGFILGDEGSGAAIGRDLLTAFLNHELPDPLASQLRDTFQLSRDGILQAVYKLPFPNRYLASFMPFVHAHRHEAPIAALLHHQFRMFLKRNIQPLLTDTSLPIHLVGSIAFFFQEEIRQNAQGLSLHVDTIIQAPLPRLALYHHTDA